VKSDIETLKQVIEHQHGGRSAHLHAVKVHRMPDRPGQWNGVVHTFSLVGHAHAELAYAWAAPIDGSTAQRFFAVLHQGAVTGPMEAVKAALAAIRTAA
jgi:hypothetical protein